MKKKKEITEYTAEVESTVEPAEETVEEAVEETVEESEPSRAPAPNVEENKGRWWLKYLITVATLSVFTVLVAWARGAFEAADKSALLGALSDAFFVPGVLSVCFGLIVVGSNGGAFDML